MIAIIASHPVAGRRGAAHRLLLNRIIAMCAPHRMVRVRRSRLVALVDMLRDQLSARIATAEAWVDADRLAHVDCELQQRARRMSDDYRTLYARLCLIVVQIDDHRAARNPIDDTLAARLIELCHELIEQKRLSDEVEVRLFYNRIGLRA